MFPENSHKSHCIFYERFFSENNSCDKIGCLQQSVVTIQLADLLKKENLDVICVVHWESISHNDKLSQKLLWNIIELFDIWSWLFTTGVGFSTAYKW